MTESVIALFISRFEISKSVGNSTYSFYKKCDTNITLKLLKEENLYMKATGIVRRIEARVIKTPIKYIAKARRNSPRFLRMCAI